MGQQLQVRLDRGVPVDRQPGLGAGRAQVLASATGSSQASAWKVTLYAPASAYAGAQRSGSVIIRCTSNGMRGRLAQALHHRQPDRQVGHEVVVHHVDVQPVGRALDGAHLVGEVGEVGGEDARGDDRRWRPRPSVRPAGPPVRRGCRKRLPVDSGHCGREARMRRLGVRPRRSWWPACCSPAADRRPTGVDGDLTDDWRRCARRRRSARRPAQLPRARRSSRGRWTTTRRSTAPSRTCARPSTSATFTGRPARGQPPSPAGGHRPRTPDCAKQGGRVPRRAWRTGRIAVQPGAAGPGGLVRRRPLVPLRRGRGRPRRQQPAPAARAAWPGRSTGAAPLRLGCFNPEIAGETVTRDDAPVACTKAHRAEFVGLWTRPGHRLRGAGADDRDAAPRAAAPRSRRSPACPTTTTCSTAAGWICLQPDAHRVAAR